MMEEVKFDVVSELATSESFRKYVQDLYNFYFNNPNGEIKMMDYGEMAPCKSRDAKIEPAKSILENMNDILKGLYDELRKIDDAIHSPKNVDPTAPNEPIQESLLETLDWQRNLAADSLSLAVHIREGLW